MIVGDRLVFAIESEITQAFPNIAQRALGFFVIHVGGRIFGVKEPEASMLACSFDEVESRVQRRGTHVVPVLADVDAAGVAEAYLDAIYRNSGRTDYFGLSNKEFIDTVHSKAVTWAPDGDEAFDDGSCVLQFDGGNKVRLVAFVNTSSPDDLLATIREEWVDVEIFYGVLSRWKDLFAAEWANKLERSGHALA